MPFVVMDRDRSIPDNDLRSPQAGRPYGYWLTKPCRREHILRDDNDLHNKTDYILANPLL